MRSYDFTRIEIQPTPGSSFPQEFVDNLLGMIPANMEVRADIRMRTIEVDHVQPMPESSAPQLHD